MGFSSSFRQTGSFNITATAAQVGALPIPDAGGYFAEDTINGAFQALGKGQTYNVKNFGAIGDGLTDDTDAIKSAITTAGVGGTILFPAKNTYLLTSALRPLAGQTLIGYGAIIKHANEVKTTTATAITTATNPTTFVVASAAGFRVGMQITITSGRTDNTGCYISHTITAINGNSITVSGNFTKAFPAGGTVVTNFGLIKTLSGTDNIKILGLEFDGNRANNDTYLNWQSQACLASGSSYAIFKDLYIHDAQADGIMFGGVGSVVDSCSIVRTGGNCLHLSGATGCKITNNYCKDATLSITGTDNATGPDHAEGVITFSSLIVDTIISGNHLENGRTCIGGIGSYDNSDITIIGNTMRGATLYAIEIISGETSAPYLKNIIITGNRFYDCAPVALANNQSGGVAYESGNRNVIFNDNYLQNTQLSITRLKHGTISNNVFDFTGSATAIAIYIISSNSLIISKNHIIGGKYGIYFESIITSGIELNMSNVLIDGNVLRNQKDASIHANTSAGTVYRNILISNNMIVIESGIALVGYVGIYAGNGITVSSNNLNIKGGSFGMVCSGDVVSSPYGYTGSMIDGNVVRTDTGKASIKIYGGMSNNIIHHNYVVQAIANSQPANNTVENNYTIF